jgi:hypothetical protein
LLGAGGGEEEEATTHCSGHRPPWLTSIPTGSILHGRGSAASAMALCRRPGGILPVCLIVLVVRPAALTRRWRWRGKGRGGEGTGRRMRIRLVIVGTNIE